MYSNESPRNFQKNKPKWENLKKYSEAFLHVYSRCDEYLNEWTETLKEFECFECL